MKKSFYLLLAILVCVFSYAQEDLLKAEQDPSLSPIRPYYGWSWEIGAKMHEQYPDTNYSYWFSPTSPVHIQYDYIWDRTENDRDGINQTGIFAFLPFGIDFSGKQDFSKGFVSVGAYGRFMFVDTEERTSDYPYIPNLINTSSMLDVDTDNYGAGLSTIWSFPEHGTQILFNIGYMWNNFEIEFDELIFKRPGPPPPAPQVYIPGKLKKRQKEGGLEAVLNIRMNTASRKFFSGFALQNVLYYRLEDPHSKDRFYLGNVEIPVTIPSIRGNFIQSDLYTKIIALPVWERSAPLILNNYYTQKATVSLELLTGIRHTSLNDGFENSLGCRINLFDNLFFSYRHTWQHNNDASDSDTFLVSFESSFSIAPKQK